jgi:excisionase family DNA binding protein
MKTPVEEVPPGSSRPRPRSGGPLLTAEQVGELLGVPKSWVYEQSRRGRIPTVTLGRYRRYRREAIERWIEQLETEGSSSG